MPLSIHSPLVLCWVSRTSTTFETLGTGIQQFSIVRQMLLESSLAVSHSSRRRHFPNDVASKRMTIGSIGTMRPRAGLAADVDAITTLSMSKARKALVLRNGSTLLAAGLTHVDVGL